MTAASNNRTFTLPQLKAFIDVSIGSGDGNEARDVAAQLVSGVEDGNEAGPRMAAEFTLLL